MNILNKASELAGSGKPWVMATVTSVSGSSPARPGFRLIVTGKGSGFGTIGGGAIEKLAYEKAEDFLAAPHKGRDPELVSLDLESIGMSCGGRADVFIEYFSGTKRFVVFGGGHVGSALTPMLEGLGYHVTVFDNRPDAAERLSSECRSVVLGDYSDISPVLETAADCGYCFIATHGHEWDRTVLRQLLLSGAGFSYIGMIGSAVKVQACLASLEDEGLSIPDSLYSPVGIDLGGNTTAEIAVSIAAEIVAVNNSGKALHMRDRRGRL